MPVKLYTGKPGAGKTAQLVADILKFKKAEPERPVYAININGLHESVAESLTIEQLHEWWELPPGAVICIDEAQEESFMPLDQGKPAAWVKAISKVRHHGMDFWLTTQHPDMLSAYVRKLVDEHIHTVRKFKSHVVSRFSWGRCMSSCEEGRAQKAAIHAVGTLPKEVFELYKSSTMHTMKRSIPMRAMVLPIAAVLAIAALISVPFVLRKLHRQTVAGSATVAATTPNDQQRQGGPDSQDEALRRADFAKWMRPRVDGLPWSAPMFDGLAVRATPRLYCIAADDGTCLCNTEQGTHYDVPLNTCRKMVSDGLYNPFVDAGDNQHRDRQERPGQASAAQQPTASAVLPSGAGFGASTRERATAQPYIPPEDGQWNPDALAGDSGATSKP